MSTETFDVEAFKARIMGAPSPMTQIKWPDGMKGYSMAGDAIAKAMLLVLESGETYEDAYAAYDLVCARWPGFDDWIGGATGFMVGWAASAAKECMGQRPVPNPALLTIRTLGGEE